ncbi:MAG: hypothetical protein NVSMB29_09450 [Candidatus Dormibacteria bacterium]
MGVRGDPDHPTNRGGLCSKGQALAETLRPGDRLLHPLRRPLRGDGGFDRTRPWERISWGDALGDCARRLRQIQDTHGKNAVAFYLSGQLLTEDYYVANKLVKGFLGTNNVDTNSRLCMASAAVAYKRAFGQDGPPGCYDDLEQATSVFLLGSNAAHTHPIIFGRLLAARSRSRARWVVVDPRRTDTAAAADLHLPITPGSDVALLLAMLNVCAAERLTDPRYISAHTTGFEAAAAVAAEWPPERAAAVCGVSADAIRLAARLFGGSRNTLSMWCQGLNQSIAATDKNLALINLHLATGQIGRPGAGPLSLTGQANAMGGREVGGMATELAAHRRLDSAADRAEVQAFWGSGPIQPDRGVTAVELVDELLSGRVRAVWIAGTNPVASLPDAARAEAALRRAELVVVQELVHPTDTSLLADVILPAAGWAEKTGALTSSERRVALAEAVVEPPGEARPDWRIFADLGAELGHGAAFSYRTAADVFDEHAALTRGRTCDMSGLSHRRLREAGATQWPHPAPGKLSRERLYTDGRFSTPDGRASIEPTPYVPPAEPPSDEYPLRLITVRGAHAWHTLTKTGKVARLRRLDPGPRVVVNPADAAAAGLPEGGPAEVSSRRGRWRGVAVCSPEVPAGTVATEFHCSPLWNRGAWINRLTSSALDPRSLQPELKHSAVRLTRAAPLLDGLLVIGNGRAAALAIELRAAGVAGIDVAGWDTAPPRERSWCVVADGSAACTAWLRSAELQDPVVVDAAGRIAGQERGHAVGAGVRTTGGVAVDSDPARLAAALVAGGLAGPRVLARLTIEEDGDGQASMEAGDANPGPDDEAQGVVQFRVGDTAADLQIAWRLASGQVLGVRASGPRAAVDRVTRAWCEDASPDEVRAGLASD